MKKTYKMFIMAAVVLSAMVGCNDRLDVTNPNKFTDEEIMENILMSGDEEKIRAAMEGMANTMPEKIMVGGYEAGTSMTGGFNNVDNAEHSFEFMHSLLMGDIIEGSSSNQGRWYRWYTNDPTFTFWRYDQVLGNYGNYAASVNKIAAALNVLQFLTDEVVGSNSLLKEYRARCLTVLAYGYLGLMEKYTDLQDPSSTTKQGWPIYTKYAYNTAQEPLSVKDTWNQIITWLKQAVSDFESSGIGSGGYTVGQTLDDIYDIDAGVANYILARAAMDCRDYTTAITACESVLNHYPDFIKEENYGMNTDELKAVAVRNGNGFVKDHNATNNAFYNMKVNPEIVFGWTADGTTTTSSVFHNSAFTWYFANTLQNSSMTYWQIDQALYDKMSDSDYRKACYSTEKVSYPFYRVQDNDSIFEYNDIPVYANLKFAATDAIGYSMHNISYTNTDVCYFRSSAVLLMLAEAYAQQGNESQAKAWLNKLLAARTKSGASTMTCDNTMAGMSALEMCKLQWRIEMWGERDWVFINAKRWNEAPPRAGTNHWSTTKVDLSHIIWEIPDAERLGNPYWK